MQLSEKAAKVAIPKAGKESNTADSISSSL